MSGQFTESCRTHKGANRNQCRDSLQSLVGPIKELTGINVGTVYRVLSDPCTSCTLKRRAQFIKRRAIKRRAHFIKRCTGHDGEARDSACAPRLSSSAERRMIRVAALVI
ncbi:unnamed protein product [Camellia sinensis]